MSNLIIKKGKFKGNGNDIKVSLGTDSVLCTREVHDNLRAMSQHVEELLDIFLYQFFILYAISSWYHKCNKVN